MSVRQVIGRLQGFWKAQLRWPHHHAPYQLPWKWDQIVARTRITPVPEQNRFSPSVSSLSIFQRLTRSLFTSSSPRLSSIGITSNGPVRTVAPLLGFIAAFLQESKTDEFKLSSACAVVREETTEFSKRCSSTLPPSDCYDLTGLRRISELEFGRPLGKGCNAAVYEARLPQHENPELSQKYDLAVKMMFNYSAHSNAEEILRLYENELTPSRLRHSNIIAVLQTLIDQVPLHNLSECFTLFPQALPEKLVAGGLARGQTMFVLMNKHSCTLKEDLGNREKPYELKDGLGVFVQLLEGVAKLVQEKVVHRDIKSDNILLNIGEDGKVGQAVISDFGCSLQTLTLNYTTRYTSLGGNRALMAPEVINAQPGLFSFIDYSRADLWAVGTLAYEIFTGYNPFYQGLFKLDSANYAEEVLPEVLPGRVELNRLVRAILRRDPKKRPSPAVAATACHLLLWDFPLWLVSPPSLECIHAWIEQLCVRLVCGWRSNTTQSVILATFLKRCKVNEVMEAWKIINGH